MAGYEVPKSDTKTIIGAMRILAVDVQTQDGAANAAIREAADRLEEQEALLAESNIALNDWLNIYAEEVCDKERVEEAKTRICEQGGILNYIAGLNGKYNKLNNHEN